MTLDEMIDTQLFQLNALSKPFSYEYVNSAKLKRENTNLTTQLCTGEYKTLAGYREQMVNVFGEGSPPVNKIDGIMAGYEDISRKDIQDELAFSYFLGYAWFEEIWGGVPRDVAVVTPH